MIWVRFAGMRPLKLAVLAIAAPAVLGSPAPAQAPTLQEPRWAYAVPPQAPPAPKWDETVVLSLPGSTRHYTMSEIHSTATAQARGVADWFPEDHPVMPPVVQRGDASRTLRPCGLCHFPNGAGRPENSYVAGLPHDYIVQQLKDMRDGHRKSAEPRKANAPLMIGFAKAMTDAEIEDAARYFSAIRPRLTVKVVETDRVPIMESPGELYLPVAGDRAGTEPLGNRLIETSPDVKRTEDLRDPRGVFVAYVPKGAVARGKAVVETGAHGRAAPCATCHGPDLTGVGPIPGIAGRSPSYLARQLNDFRRGARNGPTSPLMVAEAAHLTDTDILEAVAYLATRPPAPAIRR